MEASKEKFGVSSVDKIKNLDHSQLNQVHQEAKIQIIDLIINYSNVIIDDHLFVKVNKNEWKNPPIDYFKTYQITAVFFIKAEPEEIQRRREKDFGIRNRDFQVIHQIDSIQDDLEERVYELSKKSEIPFYIFNFKTFNSIFPLIIEKISSLEEEEEK